MQSLSRVYVPGFSSDEWKQPMSWIGGRNLKVSLSRVIFNCGCH